MQSGRRRLDLLVSDDDRQGVPFIIESPLADHGDQMIEVHRDVVAVGPLECRHLPCFPREAVALLHT